MDVQHSIVKGNIQSMRAGQAIIFSIAILSGGTAAYRAADFKAPETIIEKAVVTVPAPVEKMKTVIVAAHPLKFGAKLTANDLREVKWPANATPEGYITSKTTLISKDAPPRVVLSTIATNEPVLNHKISQPGQKATLSALLGKGMKAVTVRVNAVAGVAGFVLPGDIVDILNTRNKQSDVESNPDFASTYTDVLIQGVKVLAVDQRSRSETEQPTIANTVTVEVTTRQAQKLALAASIGKLSLVLRPFGSARDESTQRITLNDLTNSMISSPTTPENPRGMVMVGITRGVERNEYPVQARKNLN
jgi:pilus assembly protein CpaB